MELNKEHIDELIAKYLSGEALPEEALLLDDWKNESASNLDYFNTGRKALHIGNTDTWKKIDTEALFRNIVQQLDMSGQPPVKIKKSIPLYNYFTPLKIAATVLIISVAGVWFYKNNAKQEILLSSADSTQQQLLADGSQVFMNKNTRLKVVSGFNKKERKLKLEGEAFFEVVHNDDKPFVIDAGGVEIKDIGTSFNVKADPRSDSVFVSVFEGVVDVSNGKSTVQLLENQSVVYIRSLNQLNAVNNVAGNIGAYKTKVFHFRANTLEQVISGINAVYGDIITLENEKLSGCRITVDFNNESPETIVSIITETLGLDYKKAGSGYIITGTSCVQ